MARLRGHRDLDLGLPLYVKRPVVVGGRAFAAVDAFPWQDLELESRLLTKLWDQRRIGHEQIAERNGAEMPPSAKSRKSSKHQPRR